MRKFFVKYIDPLVPLWAIPPLAICFIFNCVIYWVTMALCAGLYHYDLTIAVDEAIPLQTGWIFIYLGYCYVFWFFSYLYVARVYRDDRETFFRFVTADVMSRLVCMLFFIFLPTTNVRPPITGTDISDRLTRFLYSIDQPTNLFPSIHCLVSWLCFVGIRGTKKVHIGIKIFSVISALAIIASTQFLKQHYIADVLAGVALAEVCYWIACHMKFPRKVAFVYAKLIERFFPGSKLR